MLVRFADLRPRFGIPYCRQHLRRLVVAGHFPAPLKLGVGANATIAWLESDLVAYQHRLVAERDASPAGGGDAASTA